MPPTRPPRLRRPRHSDYDPFEAAWLYTDKLPGEVFRLYVSGDAVVESLVHGYADGVVRVYKNTETYARFGFRDFNIPDHFWHAEVHRLTDHWVHLIELQTHDDENYIGVSASTIDGELVDAGARVFDGDAPPVQHGMDGLEQHSAALRMRVFDVLGTVLDPLALLTMAARVDTFIDARRKK